MVELTIIVVVAVCFKLVNFKIKIKTVRSQKTHKRRVLPGQYKTIKTKQPKIYIFDNLVTGAKPATGDHPFFFI